jgi:hypothetical protein
MPRSKTKNKGGRPPKCTDPVVVRDLTIVLKSWRCLSSDVARLAHISKATLMRWAARARAGDADYAWLLPMLPKEPEPSESRREFLAMILGSSGSETPPPNTAPRTGDGQVGI